MPERLPRARAYPFEAPAGSWLWRDGAVRPLGPGDAGLLDGRVAVIACGSNRAPEQIARKFGHMAGSDGTIPVERAWLADFDVVYSAHITQYGSIPATLQHLAGTRVEVSLTWLNANQLDHMHTTELPGGNYDFVRLDGISLCREGAAPGAAMSSAHAYGSRRGMLNRDGAPVPLAEVRATGRGLAALGQHEVQRLVHRRLGDGGGEDAFILASIDDAQLRRARIGQLAADAHPFAWPRVTVIGV